MAFSDRQLNVMSHIGQISAGPMLCPKVEINMSGEALMLAFNGLDISDPLTAGVIKSTIRDTVAAWRGKGEDEACVAVMMLYGPGGTNVPDMLRWKR
jgi:hypothetical protein